MVAPRTLKHIQTTCSKFTSLATIATRFGWKYQHVVEAQENKRKAALAVKHTQVMKSKQLRKNAEIKAQDKIQKIEALYSQFL